MNPESNSNKDYKVYEPTVNRATSIGKGTKIGAFCDIGENVVIGEDCNIQAHVCISNGWVIGNGVFIGPATVLLNDRFINGKCNAGSIGDLTRIGANSTILPVTVGNNCFIGAGEKVKRSMVDGETWTT